MSSLVIKNSKKVQLQSLGIRHRPSGALSGRSFLFRIGAGVPIATNHSPEVQDLPELTSSAITSNCDAAFVSSTQDLSPGPC